MKFSITYIDTACVLIEINGYKILTDPTLDDAGKLYYHGYGTFSRKTNNPALKITELENIDLVLLSHHQHKDNFDINGKKFALTVPKILSTRAAARNMRMVVGLNNWETHWIDTKKLTNLRITATPAQHHPWWIPEFLSGPVIGFIIEFDEQENGAIYISGDTVYFGGINEIAKRYKIDVGIIHVGSVQFRHLTGFGQYTMNSSDLIKSAYILNPNKIIPIHQKGWTHFKEKESALKNAIGNNEIVRKKTIYLTPGIPTQIN